MRCEACGYQFLLASSTKCPDCGDLREAIVPELKRMGDSAFLPAEVYDPGPVTRYAHEWAFEVASRGNTGFRTSEVTHANLDANTHTEPQDAPVTGIVAGPSSKDECKTEGSSYAQQRSQNAQNFIDGVTQAAAQQHAANNILRNSSIMDSTVGLKAANAHMARRVAELEADKSRRDIVAQNITPAAGLPPLGAEAWFEIAMAYRAEIEDLTRQLAAQALAHAEQMEGLKASTPKKSGSQLYAEMMGQAVDQCELTNLHRELAVARAFIEQLEEKNSSLSKSVVSRGYIIAKLESQLAMRVTPAAQQTASDVKAAQEPKAFPAGALKTGGSDPRRMGPQ